jgi:hypothetical protein
MQAIVDVHFPGLKGRLVKEALAVFYELREVPGLKKKPSTSELLDWIKLLLNEDISPETLRESDPRKVIPPLAGALVKNEQDAHLGACIPTRQRRLDLRNGCLDRAGFVAGHGPLVTGSTIAWIACLARLPDEILAPRR